ncbi:MAG: branched-chain amino acid ABC transporter permease [Betaproteobacteria bacterium]|nr:branched-chain amino acid ABC transporter permease [Betaproteobacteria bacterium]
MSGWRCLGCPRVRLDGRARGARANLRRAGLSREVAEAVAKRRVAAVRRARFIHAARLSIPGMTGTFIWGVITGVAMVQSGLSVAQAVGMTLIVFSGTAQLAALPLMASGASFLVIGFTTLLTSLRFMVYSASLSRAHSSHMAIPTMHAPDMALCSRQPKRWRLWPHAMVRILPGRRRLLPMEKRLRSRMYHFGSRLRDMF